MRHLVGALLGRDESARHRRAAGSTKSPAPSCAMPERPKALVAGFFEVVEFVSPRCQNFVGANLQEKVHGSVEKMISGRPGSMVQKRRQH